MLLRQRSRPRFWIEATPKQWRRQAWARGKSPQKCRLVPTVKRTGQESGGDMCKILMVSAV